MRKVALACFLILIPSSVRAQDTKGDWQALYGLHSGEKIEVVRSGMKEHVGTFPTVTAEAIQLREGSNDIGIPRENVVRVTCSTRTIASATLLSLELSAQELVQELAQPHPGVQFESQLETARPWEARRPVMQMHSEVLTTARRSL